MEMTQSRFLGTSSAIRENHNPGHTPSHPYLTPGLQRTQTLSTGLDEMPRANCRSALN